MVDRNIVDRSLDSTAPPAARLGLPSAALVAVVNLAAAAFMTGLIWYVQVVHYPLMAGWPHERFADWEALHRERTGAVVIPAMLLEAAATVLFVLRPPRGVPAWLPGTAAAALAGIWASTFFLQIPCHTLLSLGWDETVHARLVATNWIRTCLWTARLLLAAVAVHAILADAPAGRLQGS